MLFRSLKHKHIKKMKEGRDAWLVLNHPATKTNATEVQAMPASVHIYDKLVEFKKSKNMRLGLDEYVFLAEYSNRNTAMEVLARLFRRILEESQIEEKSGKNITLYSLRHTSIMLRLVIGRVDSLALARNARTSQRLTDPQVIHKFVKCAVKCATAADKGADQTVNSCKTRWGADSPHRPPEIGRGHV